MPMGNLLRTLTINKGAILVPHIDAYLSAGKFPETWDIQIPNFKEKDEYWHPSSHCFLTPADLWRHKKGQLKYPKPGAALRKTFDCGHMWHGYLEAILMEMGFVASEDVELVLTQEIMTDFGPTAARGTADLARVNIPSHGTWLVDIKTMNKPEFESGPLPQTFKKWQAQVNCYMDWLETDQALILAVSKDSPHDMREFRITQDHNALQEIYDRWAYVDDAIENGTPFEEVQNWEYDPDPLLLNPGDSVLDAVVADVTDKRKIQ